MFTQVFPEFYSRYIFKQEGARQGLLGGGGRGIEERAGEDRKERMKEEGMK
jgi:hypothetical protein